MFHVEKNKTKQQQQHKPVDRPVVEEHVGLPDAVGRNAHVLDVAVVARVPAQVVVRPFLEEWGQF